MGEKTKVNIQIDELKPSNALSRKIIWSYVGYNGVNRWTMGKATHARMHDALVFARPLLIYIQLCPSDRALGYVICLYNMYSPWLLALTL